MTVRREIVESPRETGVRTPDATMRTRSTLRVRGRARLPEACYSSASAIEAEGFMNNNVNQMRCSYTE